MMNRFMKCKHKMLITYIYLIAIGIVPLSYRMFALLPVAFVLGYLEDYLNEKEDSHD